MMVLIIIVDQSKNPQLLVHEKLSSFLLCGLELPMLRKLKGLSILVISKEEDCGDTPDLVTYDDPRVLEPPVIEEGVIHSDHGHGHED